MKQAFCAILILLAAAFATPAAGQPELHYTIGKSPDGVVGVCIHIAKSGRADDARLAISSGDPAMDKSVVDYVRTLRWGKPKPGWMGINFAMGAGRTDAPLPDCSAFSKATS